MQLMLAAIFIGCMLLATVTSTVFTTCDTGGTIPEFDYYLFVQQYPTGVCQVDICDQCLSLPSYHTWTIHGLWPSLEGEFGPNYCGEEGEVFELLSLKSIFRELVVTFPGLCREHGNSISFWEHEWCKHGTCGNNQPAIDSDFKYFNVSLALSRAYDIENILITNEIFPDSSIGYQLESFIDAFIEAIGVRPFLECQYNEKKGKQILYQISICLDKSFEPVYCHPSTYIRETACPLEESIYYISAHNMV